MSIIRRNYQTENDYILMRELVRRVYTLQGVPNYATIGDLDWWRYSHQDPDYTIKQVRLWFSPKGELLGFAWPNARHTDVVTLPDYQHLEAEMLSYAEEWRHEHGPVTNRLWSYEQDAPRNRLLAKNGYECSEEYLSYRYRNLNNFYETPRLPSGYSIRHVENESDFEARVAVHVNAFHPSKMTVAKHQAVAKSPSYRSELDLVVVAPDQTFAAFCIVWYDPEQRLGLFEPVGCHTDHRQLGLTRALLTEGLSRLKKLGANRVTVCCWSSEVAPARLYDSVGLYEIGRNYCWTKQLS